MNFDELVYVRDERIDDIGPFLWIKGETGVWDGPKQDWLEHHKHKIFPLVKKFDVVVQAGGALGVYPRLLSERFKTVYTFEPDYLNFHCLSNNTQVPNIVKMNCALGSTNDLVLMKRNTMHNVGMHQVVTHEDAYIPQLRIDQLNLKDCDLLWLDLEGFEIHALMGAENTIRKFKPVIVVERGLLYNIPQYLATLGYKIHSETAMDIIFVPE